MTSNDPADQAMPLPELVRLKQRISRRAAGVVVGSGLAAQVAGILASTRDESVSHPGRHRFIRTISRLLLPWSSQPHRR